MSEVLHPVEIEKRHEPGVLRAINSMSDGILTVDLENRVTYLNPAAEHLTGWRLDDAIGTPSSEVFRVVNSVTRQSAWQPIQFAMQDNARYSILPNSVLLHKDGLETPIEDSVSPIRDEENRIAGAVVAFRDVGMSRLMLLKAIYRANHDSLTTLPNRTFLDDRVSQSLSMLEGSEHVLAILFIDIDGFKSINDTHGHAAGDYVIQVVGKRLAASIRTSDTICRSGGDEFIILLPEVANAEAVGRIAEKVLRTGPAPIMVEGTLIHVSLSMGIAVSGANETYSPEALMNNADKAMYDAKRAGGNRFHWFSSSMLQAPSSRSHRENSLGSAVEQQRFLLHYQPQVDLKTRRITGVEALLRWNSEDAGLLHPLSFLPALERMGLIVEVGKFVLREAIRQQNLWRRQGFADLVMSVNVSAIELYNKGYVKAVEKILHEEGYVTGSVMLELTESVLLQFEDDVESIEILGRKGIRLAMDDFGVGYSSLNYLRRLPIDMIKIDRNFIANIETSAQDAALVRAIIQMAHSLRKTVIAEGVETIQQAEMLLDFGCDQAQGYFYGKPVTSAMLTSLLEKGVQQVQSQAQSMA